MFILRKLIPKHKILKSNLNIIIPDTLIFYKGKPKCLIYNKKEDRSFDFIMDK